MITTESTYVEIRKYLQPIEKILQERAISKTAHNIGKLMKFFAVHPDKCINSSFCDNHYTQDGIKITSHAHGLHLEQGEVLYAAKGFPKKPIVDNMHSIYFFLPNLHDGKKTLVTYDGINIRMYDAHALSRYRERFLKDTSLPFEKVAEKLIQNNTAFHTITFTAIYGKRENTKIMSCRCIDGVFLGYFDRDSVIVHLTTFISDEMLSDRQFYHSKDSDICKQFLPRMLAMRDDPNYKSEGSVFGDFYTDVKEGKTVMVEMTQDEVDAMMEEYERDPEAAKEAHRAEVQRQKFEHQQRYKMKMKKKGYK